VTFEGFAPSHRRDYLEWIVEAKQAATRAKRIDQAVEWMAQGKNVIGSTKSADLTRFVCG
jgi:uncharacterized protein YdeI (YjbR/CyaY-like superfamily)